MTTYISELHYKALQQTCRGRRLKELTRPFVYRYRSSSTRIFVKVPAGFVSDLATIPRVLWPLLPPDGEYQEAAIVHDWLYARNTNIERWMADAIFRHIAHATGVPWHVRVVLFWGIRIGGWFIWRKRRGPTASTD